MEAVTDANERSSPEEAQTGCTMSSLSANSSPTAANAVAAALSAEDRAAIEYGDAYRCILEAIGEPGYNSMKALFYGEDGPPAATIPSITVSFELFDAVQNRFANTKMMLERTKADLHTRHQQYAILQEQYEQLQVSNGILEKRVTELERNNTQLHQNIAKQEVTADQLRQQITRLKAEMEVVEEKMTKRDEELQVLHHRVAEGLISISQKETIITNLRRQLGRGATSRPGDPFGAGNGESNEYSADMLRRIADDVEGRSIESQLRLYSMELEAKIKNVEEEKKYIMLRHTLYRKHVQAVTEVYEACFMAREDAVLAHVCEVPQSLPCSVSPIAAAADDTYNSLHESSVSTKDSSYQRFPVLSAPDIQMTEDPHWRTVAPCDSLQSLALLQSPDVMRASNKTLSRGQSSHQRSSEHLGSPQYRKKSSGSPHHRSSIQQQFTRKGEAPQTHSLRQGRNSANVSESDTIKLKRAAHGELKGHRSTASSTGDQQILHGGSISPIYDNNDSISEEQRVSRGSSAGRHSQIPSSSHSGRTVLQHRPPKPPRTPSITNSSVPAGRVTSSPRSSSSFAHGLQKTGGTKRGSSAAQRDSPPLNVSRKGTYTEDGERESEVGDCSKSLLSDVVTPKHHDKRIKTTDNGYSLMQFVQDFAPKYRVLHNLLIELDKFVPPPKGRGNEGNRAQELSYLHGKDEDMSTQMEHMSKAVMDDARLVKHFLDRIQRGLLPRSNARPPGKTSASNERENVSINFISPTKRGGEKGVHASPRGSCVDSFGTQSEGKLLHESTDIPSLESRPASYRAEVPLSSLENKRDDSIIDPRSSSLVEVSGSSSMADMVDSSQQMVSPDAAPHKVREGAPLTTLPGRGERSASDRVRPTDVQPNVSAASGGRRLGPSKSISRHAPRLPSREGHRPLVANNGGVSGRTSRRDVWGNNQVAPRTVLHAKKVELGAVFPKLASRSEYVMETMGVSPANDNTTENVPSLPKFGEGGVGHTTQRMEMRARRAPQRTPWNPALLRLDLNEEGTLNQAQRAFTPFPTTTKPTLPWTAFFNRTLGQRLPPTLFLGSTAGDSDDTTAAVGAGGPGAAQFPPMLNEWSPFGWASSVPLSQRMFHNMTMPRENDLSLGGTALRVSSSFQPTQLPGRSFSPMPISASTPKGRQAPPPGALSQRGQATAPPALFSSPGFTLGTQLQQPQRQPQEQERQSAVGRMSNAFAPPNLFNGPTSKDLVNQILNSGPVRSRRSMEKNTPPYRFLGSRGFRLSPDVFFPDEGKGRTAHPVYLRPVQRRPRWASLYRFNPRVRRPSDSLCIVNSRGSSASPLVRRQQRCAKRPPRRSSLTKRWLPMKISRRRSPPKKEFFPLLIRSLRSSSTV